MAVKKNKQGPRAGWRSTRFKEGAGLVIPHFNLRKYKQIAMADISQFHSMAGVNFKKVRPVNNENEFYYFQDNGADILFIAHLDTVAREIQRVKINEPNLVESINRVYCRQADNRLGVYAGLHHIPAIFERNGLPFKYDILLTINEEKGQSTGQHFVPPQNKQYKWMFSFDRRGTGVVMYQYENDKIIKGLSKYGLTIENGTYSDIAHLEHLGCVGFNLGCGVHNGHFPGAYFDLGEYHRQLRKFVMFYGAYAHKPLPFNSRANVFAAPDHFDHVPGLGRFSLFTEYDVKMIRKIQKEHPNILKKRKYYFRSEIKDLVNKLYPKPKSLPSKYQRRKKEIADASKAEQAVNEINQHVFCRLKEPDSKDEVKIWLHPESKASDAAFISKTLESQGFTRKKYEQSKPKIVKSVCTIPMQYGDSKYKRFGTPGKVAGQPTIEYLWAESNSDQQEMFDGPSEDDLFYTDAVGFSSIDPEIDVTEAEVVRK